MPDWYLYYGDTGYVTNFNQTSHTMGRNNGSTLYTSIDLTGVDTQMFKATWSYTSFRMRNGYCKSTFYPVTGDYATVFTGIEWNTTTTEAVDVTGLTLGSAIGATASNVSSTSDYVAGEYKINNLNTYLATQRESGADSVKVAVKLVNGGASAEGLRMYNTSAKPVYIKIYVLAGAEAITPATAE